MYAVFMKITILGSGAWEGIPAPFCQCAVCKMAVEPYSKNNRTRPQLIVENSGKSFLVEVSPDIRLQSARFKLPPIKDFVISHWHFDHMYGLHELLQYSKEVTHGLNLYCSKETKRILEQEEFSYIPSTIFEARPFDSFELAGVTITPLPVRHMHAQDEKVDDNDLANTFGYLFEHAGKRVAYLADYYSIPRSVIEKVKDCDAVICEATYLFTQDYRNYKLNHLHGQDIINCANSFDAKRVYYHSISHLTHKTHEELQELLPRNHTLAYDGLALEFDH